MRFSTPTLRKFERNDFPITYKQDPNGGRTPLLLCNNMIISLHNILKKSSLHKAKTNFSKKEALFIIEYCDYLDIKLLEEKRNGEYVDKEIATKKLIKNLRSTIDNHSKHIPQWWNPYLFVD